MRVDSFSVISGTETGWMDAVLSQMCNLCSVTGPAPAFVPKERSKAGEWEQSVFALLEQIF